MNVSIDRMNVRRCRHTPYSCTTVNIWLYATVQYERAYVLTNSWKRAPLPSSTCTAVYKHTLSATGGNSILYIHAIYDSYATLILVPHALDPLRSAVEDLTWLFVRHLYGFDRIARVAKVWTLTAPTSEHHVLVMPRKYISYVLPRSYRAPRNTA